VNINFPDKQNPERHDGAWDLNPGNLCQSRMLYPLGQDDHVIGGVIQVLFKEDDMTLVEVASS